MIPTHFSIENLNKSYGMLDHPEGECFYDPFNIHNSKYRLESYGIRDENTVDHFFEKEPDFDQLQDDFDTPEVDPYTLG